MNWNAHYEQGKKLNWSPRAKISMAVAGICLLLLSMGLITVFSIAEADNNDEVARPGVYWFEEDTRSFNNIDSTKKMIVDLDEPVGDDEVRREGNIEVSPSFLKDIVDEVNVISGEEKLEIRFKNLESLTHSLEDDLVEQEEFLEYNVVFPEGSISLEHDEEYELPFKLHEVTPGFKDTFLETDYSDINDYVFDKAPPRDIAVVMPSLYIESVQTLHGGNGDGQYLSNLDIETHEDVQTMRVFFDTDDDYIELSRREDVDFTAGRAKLGRGRYDDEIKLEAYDEKGKLLEERVVRLEVDEEEDYSAEEPGVFDGTETLYDLMENPDLLEEAVTHLPVSQLNVLGLVYDFHDDEGLYLGEVEVSEDEVNIDQGDALEVDLEGANDQFENTFEGTGWVRFDVYALDGIGSSEYVEINFDANGKADDVEVLSSGDTKIPAQDDVRIYLTTQLEEDDTVDSFNVSIEAVIGDLTYEKYEYEEPNEAELNFLVSDKAGDPIEGETIEFEATETDNNGDVSIDNITFDNSAETCSDGKVSNTLKIDDNAHAANDGDLATFNAVATSETDDDIFVEVEVEINSDYEIKTIAGEDYENN